MRSENLSKKIVFKNNNGVAIRVLHTRSNDLNLVQNKNTKRIEITDSTFDYRKTHLLIQPISISDRESISLKSYGSLTIQNNSEYSYLDLGFNDSDPSQLPLTLKWSSIAHGTILSILIMFYLFLPSMKLEDNSSNKDKLVTIQIENLQQTKAPEKKTISPKEKIVLPKQAQHKPIKKITVTPRVNKNKSLKVTHSNISKSRKPTINSTVKPLKAHSKASEPTFRQLGTLGTLNAALKGIKTGSGSGLRLSGQRNGSGGNGAGSGSLKGNGTNGHGHDSGGGYEQALYGKGLIAGQVGSGQGGFGSGWGNGRKGSGSFGTKGKGGGHEGYGTSKLGSGAKSFSYPVTDEAMIEGGLDREAVILVVMKNIGQITYCYELGLQKNPGLRGRVLVDFTINGQGKVASNSISSSTLKSSQVEACMLSKIKNWKFPQPVGGVNVDVNYPFALQRVSEVSQNFTGK